MKTFTKLNILVILLALAVFSCQNENGFLSEIATAETKHYEMAFTVQVTDLNGFQIFNEETFMSGIDKILQT
jgi:hypothetical protein